MEKACREKVKTIYESARIKPAVVLDALARFSGPVCFLDADSIVPLEKSADCGGHESASRFRVLDQAGLAALTANPHLYLNDIRGR